MATVSQAGVVKSLNKSPDGRRRLVFKPVAQQIEEIEIDIFRSLDRINSSEPSDGSSFLRDCFMEWRELNTAEDFISLYQEMLPMIVQTPPPPQPLISLHKELIVSMLLSRLKLEAKLSLEPILRLIAAFSRDVPEDFLIAVLHKLIGRNNDGSWGLSTSGIKTIAVSFTNSGDQQPAKTWRPKLIKESLTVFQFF